MDLDLLKRLLKKSNGTQFFINLETGLLHDISKIQTSTQCGIETMVLDDFWAVADWSQQLELDGLRVAMLPENHNTRSEILQSITIDRAEKIIQLLELNGFCDHCFPRSIFPNN